MRQMVASHPKSRQNSAMRPIMRRLPALALLILLAAGLFWLGRYLRGKGIAWASEFSSVASLFIAIMAILAPVILRWLRNPAPMSQVSVSQAGDALAVSLGKQWAEEDRLRRINDPRPLPVRWEVTPTAQKAMAGIPHQKLNEAQIAGRFTSIRDTFENIETRRLVILGAAGAGKSVLVVKLARELLAVRKPGMPIPVILPAATWNPDRHMPDWISDQLESNHPGLARRVKSVTGETTSLAHALAYATVLPILDGLDELPEQLRAKAISEINAIGSDLPLVITSRPDEYLQATVSAGRGIARARVVELRPLRVQEVIAYLSEATATAPPRRWNAVFKQLNLNSKGPLTTVLTTPLMLWLARTVYESTEHDPSDLVNPALSTQEAIEHHLLDAFIPAVYSGQRERSRFKWTPAQAERWLGFIATYLDHIASPDLAWWRLTRATRIWRPLGIGIRTALSVAVVWTLTVFFLSRHGYWKHGSYHSNGRLSDLILDGPIGVKVRPRVDQWLALAKQNAAAHGPVSWVLTALHKLSWGSLPLLTLQVGLIATLLGVVTLSDIPSPRAIEFGLLRAIRHVLIVLVVSFGAVALLVLGALHYSLTSAAARSALHTPSGHLFLLLFILFFLTGIIPPSSAEVDEARATSPASVLRLDRHAGFLALLAGNMLFVGLLFIYTGLEITLLYCAWFIIVMLVRFTLGGVNYASWLFNDARIWLACGRRLPWRPITFLVDAHNRGVLRQVGAVYQFRHIRLQERLSSRARTPLAWVLDSKLSPVVNWITPYYQEFIGTSRASSQGKWEIDRHGWQFRRTGVSTIVYRDSRFDQLANLPPTEEQPPEPGSDE
jgi:NACHT domain